MAQTFTSTYAGQILPKYISAMVQEMDALEKGYLAVNTGIAKNLVIPTMDLTGDFVQAYATTLTSVGTFVNAERNLALTDLSIQIGDLDPRAFEKFWAALGNFKPENPFVYLATDPILLEKFTSMVITRSSNVWMNNIWKGNLASSPATPSNKFTGVIKQIVTTGGYVDVSPSSPDPITKDNVKDYLQDVFEALLVMGMFDSPDTKILVSKKTAAFYMQAEQDVVGKGRTSMDMYNINNLDYFGVPVRISNGFPDEYMICTYTSKDPLASNLHFGVRNENDMSNVVFEKQANGSKGWVLRVDTAMGTQVGIASDVIYLKAD